MVNTGLWEKSAFERRASIHRVFLAKRQRLVKICFGRAMERSDRHCTGRMRRRSVVELEKKPVATIQQQRFSSDDSAVTQSQQQRVQGRFRAVTVELRERMATELLTPFEIPQLEQQQTHAKVLQEFLPNLLARVLRSVVELEKKPAATIQQQRFSNDDSAVTQSQQQRNFISWRLATQAPSSPQKFRFSRREARFFVQETPPVEIRKAQDETVEENQLEGRQLVEQIRNPAPDQISLCNLRILEDKLICLIKTNRARRSEKRKSGSKSPGRRHVRRRPPRRARTAARATPSRAGRAMDILMSCAGRATGARWTGDVARGRLGAAASTSGACGACWLACCALDGRRDAHWLRNVTAAHRAMAGRRCTLLLRHDMRRWPA
ncbi:hypothetical protein F511_24309 [Dorcoceras hygrometricum]|uniref:Uncharacterized protein n=1 Tax=Dorcoceras hygrometricum TaxID=472368 RepID=A0A2Z7CMI9_9LAMI|nr:hypothetical protein F511_24309 [Dorcoceras hygrometricum]